MKHLIISIFVLILIFSCDLSEKENAQNPQPDKKWALNAIVNDSNVILNITGNGYCGETEDCSSQHWFHVSILKVGHDNGFTDHISELEDWSSANHHYGNLYRNMYHEGRLQNFTDWNNIEAQFNIPRASGGSPNFENQKGNDGQYVECDCTFATGNSNQTEFIGLSSGKYEIIVTPVFGIQETDINHKSKNGQPKIFDTHPIIATTNFEIPAIIPPAPFLISPPNDSIIISSFVNFEWTSVTGASHYTLDINDSSFSSNLTSKTINYFNNGTYTWKVKALLSAGGETAWSSLQSITINNPDSNVVAIAGPTDVNGPSNIFPEPITKTYKAFVINPPPSFTYKWYKTIDDRIYVDSNSSYIHTFYKTNDPYQLLLEVDILQDNLIIATARKLVSVTPFLGSGN